MQISQFIAYSCTRIDLVEERFSNKLNARILFNIYSQDHVKKQRRWNSERKTYITARFLFTGLKRVTRRRNKIEYRDFLFNEKEQESSFHRFLSEHLPWKSSFNIILSNNLIRETLFRDKYLKKNGTTGVYTFYIGWVVTRMDCNTHFYRRWITKLRQLKKKKVSLTRIHFLFLNLWHPQCREKESRSKKNLNQSRAFKSKHVRGK